MISGSYNPHQHSPLPLSAEMLLGLTLQLYKVKLGPIQRPGQDSWSVGHSALAVAVRLFF